MKSPIQSAVFNSALLSLATGALSCVGQGAGNCNLEIRGGLADQILYKQFWGTATIYNYKCETIGYYEKPTQGLAMYSQLPWTVDLNYLPSYGTTDLGFCYGSYCFRGNFACTGDYEKLSGYESLDCMHAFPC